MKQYRTTFHTSNLDVWDMCEIIKTAKQSVCDIEFSDFNIFIHVDTDDYYTYQVLKNFREISDYKNQNKQTEL